MRRWLVTMAWSALLLPVTSEVLRPSFASSEREIQTKSQSSAASFDPVKCSVTEPIGVTMGDLVSCASPEPEEGPAGGFPGGPDPENFDRKPGDDYAGLHGEPKRLPRPANCATPVRGTFTFDGGVLTRVSERNGRRVREMYFHTHYTSGFGEGGRSVLALDMWDDPDTGDVSLSVENCTKERSPAAPDPSRSGTMAALSPTERRSEEPSPSAVLRD